MAAAASIAVPSAITMTVAVACPIALSHAAALTGTVSVPIACTVSVTAGYGFGIARECGNTVAISRMVSPCTSSGVMLASSDCNSRNA